LPGPASAGGVAWHDYQVEELDIEAALNFAEYVTTNAVSLYAQLSIEQKRRFLAVLAQWAGTSIRERVCRSTEGFPEGKSQTQPTLYLPLKVFQGPA
jgi:hypothetical protein